MITYDKESVNKIQRQHRAEHIERGYYLCACSKVLYTKEAVLFHQIVEWQKIALIKGENK